MGLIGGTFVGPNARDAVTLKRVFCTSTAALKRGYPVCYDRDNITALDNTGTAIAASSSSWARHRYVEQPAAGNLHRFAGIVARDYDANSAGQFVDIEVPGGFVTDLWTDVSCTINSTKLSLEPGAWTFASGTGPVVAECVQTVDRSSTAGLVQAIVWPTNEQSNEYGAIAGSVPSSSIWSNFPNVSDMIANPSLGIWFDTRFNSPIAHYADAAATTLPVAGGGIALLSTTDNQEVGFLGTHGGFNIAEAGTKLGFECRFKITNVTETAGFLIGLSSGSLGQADILLDAGAVPSTSLSSVGLSVPEADPDGGDVFYQLAGQSLNIHDADAVTVAGDTYINFGLYFDGTDCTTYLNGTSIGDPILSTDIDDSDFPDGVAMRPCAWLKQGDTNDHVLTVQWMRAIQLAS